MKKIISRRPSASMLVAIAALVLAAGGTAIAASHLLSGDKLIKKGTLSGNRLRKHTLTGTQINLNKLGKVPSAKNADHATRASTATSATSATNATNAINATRAASAASTDGYFNSGLVTLTASTTTPGTQKTLVTRGPFSFIAECLDDGSGSFTANVVVKDNSASGAIEEDDKTVNDNPPSTLNAGDTHTVFYPVTESAPYWFGDYYNLFSVAAPGGPALSGEGSIGVHVLGADCAFQLVLFG